jgi:hypothetical protein
MISLSPGQSDIVISGGCPSEAVELGSMKLTIWATALHMHKRGRSITAVVNRDGALATTLDQNPKYDFEQQKFVKLATTFDIIANDEVRVTCHYDTTAETATVVGGEGTDNEMCLVVLAFYPLIDSAGCYFPLESDESSLLTTALALALFQ